MTYIKDVFGQDLFKDFNKLYVGFDDQFNRMAKIRDDLSKTTNYPPYNIKRDSDDVYVIEIAVAGFEQSEINVEVDDGHLIVRGNRGEASSDSSYMFKGISNRSFTRTFTLGEYIEVTGAEMLNGMLTINLQRIVPEHQKPKKITISNLNKPQLITE